MEEHGIERALERRGEMKQSDDPLCSVDLDTKSTYTSPLGRYVSKT